MQSQREDRSRAKARVSYLDSRAPRFILPRATPYRALAWEARARDLGITQGMSLGWDPFAPGHVGLTGLFEELIARTPHLIWRVVTDNIEAVPELVPESWVAGPRSGYNHPGGWPPNVHVGVRVNHQSALNEDAPLLTEVRAAARFVLVTSLEVLEFASHLEAMWRCPSCGRRGHYLEFCPDDDETVACPTGVVCAGSRPGSEISEIMCFYRYLLTAAAKTRIDTLASLCGKHAVDLTIEAPGGHRGDQG